MYESNEELLEEEEKKNKREEGGKKKIGSIRGRLIMHARLVGRH